jgi:hypothetical protein
MLNHQYFLNNIKGVWLISPLILLLSACSIGVTPSEQNMPLALPFGVEVQSMRTTPAIGSRIIDESQLEAGDILLSRSPNVTSLGVRAFTTSSVSHASLYIGDGLVAEAIRSGVRTIDLPHVIDESMMVAVYRYPDLATIDKVKIREFSLAQVGKKYNFKGIIFMMPYSFTRQLCELPPMREKNPQRLFVLLSVCPIGQFKQRQAKFLLFSVCFRSL